MQKKTKNKVILKSYSSSDLILLEDCNLWSYDKILSWLSYLVAVYQSCSGKFYKIPRKAAAFGYCMLCLLWAFFNRRCAAISLQQNIFFCATVHDCISNKKTKHTAA